MADKTLISGSLLKYKSWLKWSSKNFVLTQETLSYDSLSTRREGCIHIKNIRVENVGSGNSFNVINTVTNTTLYLKAPSVEEKIQWIDTINQAIDSIIQCGNLKKWTNLLKGWQLRYFILYKDRLCYYLTKETVTLRRGTIYLFNRRVNVTSSSAKYGFDVASMRGNTTWYLKAASEEELYTWTSKLSLIVTQDPTSALERSTSTAKLVETCPPVQASAPPLPGSTSSSVADEDSDVESNYRKDLECNICLELLHEPTTLTCGHSFCRNCLADLWSADPNRFSCPACRQAIQSVPNTNIALQNLIRVLYENEGEAREVSQHREAFDNFCNRGSPATASANRGGSVSTGTGPRSGLQTNIEYEFLKRGMCLIFVLWVGSKVLSPIIPSTTEQTFVEKTETEDNGTLWMHLESRNTIIFLLMGVMQSPRFLAVYVVLFWYSSVYYPALEVIAHITNQVVGLGFHLKVLLWGAADPYIWLIPVLLHHEQYLAAAASVVLAIIEAWGVFLYARQILALYVNQQNTRAAYRYYLKEAKREGLVSVMRLALARAISYLPWTWLPDVIYYCALLYLTAELVSKSVARARALLERTRSLGLPGVQISTVLMSTAH